MRWLKKLTDIGVREGCAVQLVYVPTFLGGWPEPEASPVLPEVGDVGLLRATHVKIIDPGWGYEIERSKQYEVLWFRIGKPVRVYRRQIRRVK